MAVELTVPMLKEAEGGGGASMSLSYVETDQTTKTNQPTKTEDLNSISPIICKAHKIHKGILTSLIISNKYHKQVLFI